MLESVRLRVRVRMRDTLMEGKRMVKTKTLYRGICHCVLIYKTSCGFYSVGKKKEKKKTIIKGVVLDV